MTSNIEISLLISAIGLIGIFIFMTLFYLIILLLDKLFPFVDNNESNQV